jgi:hypothetical protein
LQLLLLLPSPSIEDCRREIVTMKKFLDTVCWVGMVLSLALIGLGVWCHFNMDAIVRIPFVFLPVGAGLMIGLYSLERLLRQRK